MVFKASKWYQRPLCCGNTLLREALHDELAPRVLSLASGENPGTKVWIWQDKRARWARSDIGWRVRRQSRLLPKTFFLFTESFDRGCTSRDFFNTDNFIIPHLIQIYLLVKNVWKQNLFLSIFLFYELLENWKFYTGKKWIGLKGKEGKKQKKDFVVGRIRTCAGRPQWISSPSP